MPVHHPFGRAGDEWLARAGLHGSYGLRVDSPLRLIAFLSEEIAAVEKQTRRLLCDEPGYRAVQAIAGIGPVLAAAIGDVHRFPRPQSDATCAPDAPSPPLPLHAVRRSRCRCALLQAGR